MGALDYFLLTLLFFGAVNALQVLGFDMQFGQVGVVNLAYILLVAIGAYATAIASVQPAGHIIAVTYIGGFGWGFPWNLLFGIAVTVAAAFLLSTIAFRRLRYDYLALVLVSVGEAVLLLATNQTNIVNGETGIVGVTGPLQNSLSNSAWYIFMSLLAVAALVVMCIFYWRVESSPLGRLFKGVREDELLVDSIGRNSARLKSMGFLLGAACAGLAGGLLVLFIGGWSVGGWQPGETFIIVAALILGGRGRITGALVGAFVLMELFLQGGSLLKLPVSPVTLPVYQQLIAGIAILAILWWRPQGLFPEKKEKFLPSLNSRDVSKEKADQNVLASDEGYDLAQELKNIEKVSVLENLDGQMAIEISNLVKSYGGVAAVNGVSLSIPRGAFYGIIGPNGSGKSTLVDCISGVVRDYEGSVQFGGMDITGWPVHKISKLGLLRTFQTSRLFGPMSSLSNVVIAAHDQPGEKFLQAVFGKWRTAQSGPVARARELLVSYGLSSRENAYAAELSGGQRRLLELARLSIMHPVAVLLDEPFAGVSPIQRAQLTRRLMSLKDAGVTVVMIEHRLELVEQLCDRIGVMAEGRIIAEGTMEELRSDKAVLSAYLGSVGYDEARM